MDPFIVLQMQDAWMTMIWRLKKKDLSCRDRSLRSSSSIKPTSMDYTRDDTSNTFFFPPPS
jgi:hypothetical protein